MFNKSQDKRNLVIALAKFNRMYAQVTVQERTTDELETVANYGKNMLKLFFDFFKNEDEILSKVKTLQKALQTRKNKSQEGIK